MERISRSSKNTALIIWLGTIPLGFVPGLLLYLTKRDDAYIQEQSREALNWSITMSIAYLGSIVLTLLAVGKFLFPALALCHLLLCLTGAVAVSRGEPFRAPFVVRLI